MNRSLALVYVVSFCGLVTFNLMLGVTPIFAVQSGHGALGGALSTAVFMFATVAAELVTTRVMKAIGGQRTLAIGVALLCLPVFALLLSASLPLILAVSVVRGFGFAFVVISGAAMVAALAPDGKRGEGIGLYGVIIGLPTIFALPFGVALVDHIGFVPLFIIGGSLGLVGVLAAIARLPNTHPADAHGLLQALRHVGILRIAVVFCAATLASGLLVTYLSIGSFSTATAAVALLALQLSSTVSRWLAGRFADRRDARLLLVPALGVIVAAILLVLLAPHLVIVGTALFGLSFGVLQNASLHVMFETTGPSGYGAVSAIWNIAYDTGLGVGALGFGLLGADYALGFSAALVAAAIAVIAFSRRSGSSYSNQVTPG